MSHVFPRHTKSNLPTIANGKGVYLYDTKGKEYLDACGGAAVSCLGHDDSSVKDAIKAQLENVAYAHTSFFTSEPAEKLAEKLISHAPKPIDRVYFVSGGSEAIEASLKLARQYFLEIGKPEKHHVIARKQSYHGNTLGALAAGGNEWRRKAFSPLMIETSHISPCYEYRGRLEAETPSEYAIRVANELESEILRIGKDKVMAFIAEPVVGATLGAVPALDGYFKRIREICTQYDVLLILDEVMCGMGRCGTLFACEQDQISPDIITIAKGLGAGYQPIGAMMCSAEIYQAIEKGSGFFQHGHTYLAHPMACAASLAVVQRLTENDLIKRSAEMGNKLNQALKAAFSSHVNIGDIRGRGLFQGIELVEDKQTKAPFSPERAVHKAIKKISFEEGLMCYPMGGTIDGHLGDHILLAPPFIIEDRHIDEIITKLSATFDRVLS